MQKQIDTAVRWWGNQLRTIAPQNNGDAEQSGIATVFAFELGKQDETRVIAFEDSLKILLVKHLSKTWEPDEPGRGSYLRVIACDYAPSSVLREAAIAGGIKPHCPPFPMKTVMWINPDEVSVSCGYGASPEQIWVAEEKAGSDDD